MKHCRYGLVWCTLQVLRCCFVSFVLRSIVALQALSYALLLLVPLLFGLFCWVFSVTACDIFFNDLSLRYFALLGLSASGSPSSPWNSLCKPSQGIKIIPVQACAGKGNAHFMHNASLFCVLRALWFFLCVIYLARTWYSSMCCVLFA